MKVLHSICQQIWKTQQWPQDWKRSVFISIPKKGNAKERSEYHRIALISHASEVMSKILQARLQQNVNHELPDFKLALEKEEESEIKLPTSAGSSKKQETKRLFYTSVSFLLSHVQGYRYHLSKFHIYALVYYIGVFLSGLLHSV